MIGIGIIGFGYWGENLLRAFSQSRDCKVCWIADPDSERHNRVPNKINAIEDYREELNDSKTEAVVIATPSSMHYGIAKEALEAGKHVFVEKPLTMNYRHTEQLRSIAEGRNLILMVDHLLLYHPAVTELLVWVGAGEIGKIRYMHAQRLGAKVRDEENVLWSLGPHDLSIALALMDDDPEKVRAKGNIYIEKDNPVDDVVFLELIFPDGTIAHFHFSWFDQHRIRRFTVVADRGSAVFDDRDIEKLRLYKGKTCTLPLFGKEPALDIACRHFISCIENGQRPLTDGTWGLRVTRTLERAQRCLDAKK